MAAYLAPDQAGGRAYLAPDAAPAGTTLVYSDLSATYAIGALVAADMAATYAIAALVRADLAGTYSIATLVSADLAATYTISALVHTDLVADFSIESITLVSADLVASYAVSAIVSADLVAAYAIAGLVHADLAAAYSVAGLVYGDLMASYSIGDVPSRPSPPLATVVFAGTPNRIVFGGTANTIIFTTRSNMSPDTMEILYKDPDDQRFYYADVTEDLDIMGTTAATVTPIVAGVTVLTAPAINGNVIKTKLGSLDVSTSPVNYCTLRITTADGQVFDRTTWFMRRDG